MSEAEIPGPGDYVKYEAWPGVWVYGETWTKEEFIQREKDASVSLGEPWTDEYEKWITWSYLGWVAQGKLPGLYRSVLETKGDIANVPARTLTKITKDEYEQATKEFER